MNLLRNSLVGLVLTTLFLFFANPVNAQAYKETYNAAREAAKANNLVEARAKFAEAAKGAEEADDSDIATRSRYLTAQIDYKLGTAAMKAEDYETALLHYVNGATIYPDYIKNHYGHGLALKKLDRMEEALDHLIYVAQGSGDRRTSLAAENAIRGHFIHQASSAVGKPNATSRDADRAIAILDEYSDYLDPDADYYYYLAEAHHIKGQFQQVIDASDKALELHNGSRTDKAKIYFVKGEALVSAGNTEAAKAAFENAAFGSYKARAEHYISIL